MNKSKEVEEKERLESRLKKIKTKMQELGKEYRMIIIRLENLHLSKVKKK